MGVHEDKEGIGAQAQLKLSAMDAAVLAVLAGAKYARVSFGKYDDHDPDSPGGSSGAPGLPLESVGVSEFAFNAALALTLVAWVVLRFYSHRARNSLG